MRLKWLSLAQTNKFRVSYCFRPFDVLSLQHQYSEACHSGVQGMSPRRDEPERQDHHVVIPLYLSDCITGLAFGFTPLAGQALVGYAQWSPKYCRCMGLSYTITSNRRYKWSCSRYNGSWPMHDISQPIPSSAYWIPNVDDSIPRITTAIRCSSM